MATYVIGDVHGCYRELNDLLKTCGYQDGDALWFVGDLVNRGADSLAVLRMVRELPNTILVLGNHDLYLLALYHGMPYPKVSEPMQVILAAKDVDDLCGWLQQQPLLHHDETFNTVMVHAGIWPLWDLEEAKSAARLAERLMQSNDAQTFWRQLFGNEPAKYEGASGVDQCRFIVNAFARMRYCQPDGSLELTNTLPAKEGIQQGLHPWYAWPGRRPIQETILFGHWSSLEGRCEVEGIEALDTGCVWGGSLTAMRLEDGQRFSVPSVQ